MHSIGVSISIVTASVMHEIGWAHCRLLENPHSPLQRGPTMWFDDVWLDKIIAERNNAWAERRRIIRGGCDDAYLHQIAGLPFLDFTLTSQILRMQHCHKCFTCHCHEWVCGKILDEHIAESLKTPSAFTTWLECVTYFIIGLNMLGFVTVSRFFFILSNACFLIILLKLTNWSIAPIPEKGTKLRWYEHLIG